MKFNNVSQRVGYFISKSILQTPDDVTEVVKLLAGNDYLPTASDENSDDDAQTIRLQMISKDKKYVIVIMGESVNVIRRKASEDDELGALQAHADKSTEILSKIREHYEFELKDAAVESDYYAPSDSETAAIFYKKFAIGDEVPQAWRFNRLFKYPIADLENVGMLVHQTFMRDEVQMKFEEKSQDRLLLELTCFSSFNNTPSDEKLAKAISHFTTHLIDTYRQYDV